jgi:hypothetical protein
MGHPMEDYWLGESMARDRAHARRDKVFEALKNVKLSEFTVGELHDLMLLVDSKLTSCDEVLERVEKLVVERARIFRHGMRVRYRKPKKHRQKARRRTRHLSSRQVRYRKPKKGQKGIGIVKSKPRRGSRIVYVNGPRGWAGWTRVDDLEIVDA